MVGSQYGKVKAGEEVIGKYDGIPQGDETVENECHTIMIRHRHRLKVGKI